MYFAAKIIAAVDNKQTALDLLKKNAKSKIESLPIEKLSNLFFIGLDKFIAFETSDHCTYPPYVLDTILSWVGIKSDMTGLIKENQKSYDN